MTLRPGARAGATGPVHGHCPPVSRARCGPVPAWRRGTGHLPEHARHHRLRLPRRGEGDPDQSRRGGLHDPARRAHRPADLAPVIQAPWLEVDSLDETARGAGGFGSTGALNAAAHPQHILHVVKPRRPVGDPGRPAPRHGRTGRGRERNATRVRISSSPRRAPRGCSPTIPPPRATEKPMEPASTQARSARRARGPEAPLKSPTSADGRRLARASGRCRRAHRPCAGGGPRTPRCRNPARSAPGRPGRPGPTAH